MNRYFHFTIIGFDKCKPYKNKIKTNSAFTLIELVITVTIISVLSLIVYPSYQEHIKKTKRQSGMQALQHAVTVIERFKVNHGFNYQCLSLQPSTCDANGQSIKIQPPVDELIPADDPQYSLSLSISNDKLSYTLTATPLAESVLNDDGNLVINSKGQKTWRGKSCWPVSGNDC